MDLNIYLRFYLYSKLFKACNLMITSNYEIFQRSILHNVLNKFKLYTYMYFRTLEINEYVEVLKLNRI